MKSLRTTLITAIATLLAFGSSSAQEVFIPARHIDNDIRGRVEGAFEWEATKHLSLSAEVQMRLNNDLSDVDRFHTSAGVKYEVCKHFDIGADYILINIRDNAARVWEKPRHRVNINAEGSVSIGRIDLSLRERLQTTFRTDSVNRFEKANPELILRSRLQAEYNIRHSKWTPYILFEINNTLNAPKVVANYKEAQMSRDNYITRYRAGIGTKYRIDRNHRLEFYYYFDYNRDFDIDYRGNKGTLKGYAEECSYRHIIGISYKFKL